MSNTLWSRQPVRQECTNGSCHKRATHTASCLWEAKRLPLRSFKRTLSKGQISAKEKWAIINAGRNWWRLELPNSLQPVVALRWFDWLHPEKLQLHSKRNAKVYFDKSISDVNLEDTRAWTFLFLRKKKSLFTSTNPFLRANRFQLTPAAKLSPSRLDEKPHVGLSKC